MTEEKSLDYQIKYIWDNIKGFHIVHYIYTGHELGLFDLIAKNKENGISIKELSLSKSLNFSYLSKWCHSGLAWGILEDDNGLIKLASHMEYILTKPGDPRYLLPYLKSCIDHFGPDMKNHAEFYKSGKTYKFQDHGKKFSDDIGSITEGLQTLMVHKLLPNIDSIDKNLKDGVSFLDFGCGTAKLLIKMSEKYPNSDYYGLDIDKLGIKIGNEHIKSINKEAKIILIDSTVDKLPNKESIDIITMVEVLHEIEKGIRQDILTSLSSYIKKDGYLVILDETMPQNEQLTDQKYKLSVLTQYNEMTWGNEVPTEVEQNKLLKNAGFSAPERTTIGGLFTLLVSRKI